MEDQPERDGCPICGGSMPCPGGGRIHEEYDKQKKIPNPPPIALFIGGCPTCDRCSQEDATVQITLPKYGQRCLCTTCLTSLVERGLKQ